MKTVDELMMDNAHLLFDAVFNGMPVKQVQRVPEKVAPSLVDDDRSQSQSRADYIADLDDDACADLICEIAQDSWSEIAEAIAKSDAFELQRLFEKAIDKQVDR